MKIEVNLTDYPLLPLDEQVIYTATLICVLGKQSMRTFPFIRFTVLVQDKNKKTMFWLL